MREVYKPTGNESGPNYVLDLDGPDGNVYILFGLIENFLGEEAVTESQQGDGYEGVLEYCLHNLTSDPIGVEFRMYGQEVCHVRDYNEALYEAQGE